MAKINVLHITPLLTVGGAEKKLLYLLRFLDRDRFSHHVVYALTGGFADGIKNEHIPLVRIHPLSLVNPLSLLSIVRIYRYIRKNKIDLVHCHLDVAYILGGIAARTARVPLIFSFQNIADERVLGYYRIFKYLEKAMSCVTDRILVESRAVADVLSSWGIAREKIEIIPNGVVIPARESALMEQAATLREKLGRKGRFLIGNLARLVDFKNHRLLLAAAARVVQSRPQALFLIIGDGPLRGELERQAQDLGIENNVMFLGTVLDFEPYLLACDLFVLSSLTESTPLALLHALALGLPVIATSVGDIPALIRDGEDGVLVPSNDVDALAHAVIDLIDHEDKRHRLGRAGRETAAREFSIDRMADRTATVYSALAERAKRHA